MTTEKGETMSTTELIAEAREYADAISGSENENWMRLVLVVNDMADALEAATAPAEADREALIERLSFADDADKTFPEEYADVLVAAGFSRHPQPETEWEYGRTSRDRLSVDVLAGTPGNIEYQQEHGYGIVRRRKAGPWLRVTPEEAD